MSVRAIHVIEGWWGGARGESATDAASACCAAWMRDRPGDVAVVLGPAQAAARVRAAGVRVAAAWSPPLGLNGLAQRPLRRIVDDLATGGGFAGAIVWTPGAMAAAVGLGLPLTDMTTGAAWAAATPTAMVSAGEARRVLCDEMGVCAEGVEATAEDGFEIRGGEALDADDDGAGGEVAETLAFPVEERGDAADEVEEREEVDGAEEVPEDDLRGAELEAFGVDDPLAHGGGDGVVMDAYCSYVSRYNASPPTPTKV